MATHGRPRPTTARESVAPPSKFLQMPPAFRRPIGGSRQHPTWLLRFAPQPTAPGHAPSNLAGRITQSFHGLSRPQKPDQGQQNLVWYQDQTVQVRTSSLRRFRAEPWGQARLRLRFLRTVRRLA